MQTQEIQASFVLPAQYYRILRHQVCYGLMHIPQHFKPNDNFAPDSIAHFKQAIAILIQETTQVSNTYTSFTHLQLEISKFTTSPENFTE